MRTATSTQPIFVKVPCAENYDAMTPAATGRMCGTCTHLVTDFTDWKQEDIIAFLKSRNGEKTCGYFRPGQLGTPRKSWFRHLKVSVLAAFVLWLSKSDLKAQDTTKVEKARAPFTISDSVVVVVKGEVKCNGRIVSYGTVVARNENGDTIGTADVSNGRFEMRVPVSSPKQEFSITVDAHGYRKYEIQGYSSAAGNVIGVELEKKGLFRKKTPTYRVVGCPAF